MRKPLKFEESSENDMRLAFFLDREPSEVARLTKAFRLLIERDVGPLCEWKQSLDKESINFNVKSA